jgi:hypothetical protein
LDGELFVCTVHRRADRTIIDLFFTTETFTGTPRICEPSKCDGLPVDSLPQPFAHDMGIAVDCVRGTIPGHGLYHSEGWS